VIAAFLSVNGYKLEFDTAAAFQFMIELYESGTFRFAKLETWLRQHARLAGSPGR
jgi:prophage maintenance system killer protein